MSAVDATYIIDKVKGHHYQVACGKYFEAKHKGTTLIETELGGIEHPNQYFEQSVKFHTAKDEATAATKPDKIDKAAETQDKAPQAEVQA